MDFNPSKLKTNCGFCSISRALFVTKAIQIDADELYLQTLSRLGIQREGDHDPIPRMLIFPEAGLDTMTPTVEYQALKDGVHGLSSYTITSVAEANDLRFDLSAKDVSLPNQFLTFYAQAASRTTDEGFTTGSWVRWICLCDSVEGCEVRRLCLQAGRPALLIEAQRGAAQVDLVA
jgi:hypothetical protein